MKIILRAYFHQNSFQLAKNLLGSGSGSGTGSRRFRKSYPDPDPVKNRPDPQHCCERIHSM
jgi:hypothetical protein